MSSKTTKFKYWDNDSITPGYKGRIEVVMGPMFAGVLLFFFLISYTPRFFSIGKSTELLRRVKMHRHADKKCLVLKPKMDDRHTDDDGNLKECVITHDGYEMDAMICGHVKDALSFCFGPHDKHDVVAIDEGQFFPDLADSCELLANYGMIVIVACLSGSFERKFMGNVEDLLPMAEKVKMLRSICGICREEKASFTKEKVSGTVGPTGIKVGGSESYIPVCRICFYA